MTSVIVVAMVDLAPEVELYTDGGCRPNPGPGGWAAVLLIPDQEPRELSGGEPETTNNRMELRAAVEGLRALADPHRVALHTDSEYLRQGVTRWLPRWRANGWRTAARGTVKNQDLWRELEGELDRHLVTWHWVKGHSGDRWNERADALAARAIPRPKLPIDDPGAVHLFTAVAYSGKRSVGGWATLFRFGDRERLSSDRVERSSANRMHLEAAVSGLGQLTRPVRVHIYTTSDYLHDGATAWLDRWRSRGWQTRDGRPVAHRDLWQKLAVLIDRHRALWHVAERDELPDEMRRAKEAARAALDEPDRAGRD